MVVGDPGRINQILNNLVGNAIKFTKQGSINIEVNLSESIENIRSFTCAITDTGIGIPAESLDGLFESFSQVDASTTRKFGGTGLGLAISKRLVKLMGGDINVTSELGLGSCFKFTIPLGKSDKKPEQIIKPSTTLTDLNIPKWPVNTRLLLVEDNRVNQLVIQGILKHFSLKADVASNGIEGINALERSSKPYDLILMDCQMPEMDGYDATRHIRSHTQGVYNANTPIIALTANAMSGDKDKCMNAGMSDYLTKPIEPEELLSRLKYWLKPNPV
jgi:CheY-like chemotaxis protein